TLACSFHDFNRPSEDQRLLTGLIGGMAALMLVMASAVHLHEAHGGVLANGEFSIVDRITVFRPQGPPPVFDIDETTPEEVEPPARPSRSTGSSRATHSDAALRARPPQR
ncbi:MAG: hypothetical protein EA417_01290, partial [Gammaproteobacteria bacterium]